MFGAPTANAQVYIETDLTSQFNSLATTQWTGASGQVGWAAPQVTTNSGLTVAAWERYNGSCDWTGDIMYTTVTGLVAGTYKIELYGAAAFTFGRGFGSTAFTGSFSVDASSSYKENDHIDENTGVTLYATTSEGTVSEEIPIYYATNFNTSGIATATLNNVVVGSNGQIKIGLSKTSTSTNWHVVQLKGVTATVDAEATFATFKAEAEGLYNSPMNGTVLSELQAAANVDLSSAGADEYKTAIETLQAKIIPAKASIANYAEAKNILDAANIYDEAGQASYAADETITAIQAAYDDRSLVAVTAEQKTAAQAALTAACKAQTQPVDGCDMTAYITNPDFDGGNYNGWTRDIPFGGNCAIQGGSRMEYWAGNASDRAKASFNIYQKLTNLPMGVYTISADMYNSLNDEGGNYTVFSPTCGVYGSAANEEVALVTVEGTTLNPYTTGEVFVTSGNLTIGTKNTVTPMAARWFVFDNVKLTYVRQMTSEEFEPYAKVEAVAAYEEALAAAKAIEEGTIPSTAYTYLQTAIAQYTITDGTSSEYNAAAAVLKQAATVAQSLVAPYAAWKELKAYADALVAVSTNYTEKNETLASAISTQNTAAEGATSANAITTATATLKTAMVTYATTAEPTNNECFDLTFMIVNQHFTEGEGGTAVPTGWTLESGSITEHRILTHNFEAYHRQFNLSQTIAGLQKGTYKVTLQGFARHDNNGPTDKTNLYCGIVDQKIKDIKDEYSTTSIVSGKPAMGDNNGESSYTLNNQTVYQPNGMSGSYYFFQEINPATGQPFYTNEVQTLIPTDGDLKIGFKCETNTDWVIWDNFHLYYYGSAIDVTIDEDSDNSTFSEDVENANVTLKRTFSAGKWNTIALPFELSDAETKAAFGDDAQVATYSETVFENDKNSSTVTFDIASDAAIKANTPVLLKTSTDETTFTFDGKAIKAGEAKAEGANFDFVGTYAATTTIAKGDYFIGNNQLWRSEGATTIKGTRAYLKAKNDNPEARIAGFVVNDEVTAIEGLTVENSNNAALYNLNGQRISTPKKGLYIREGKKFVVK
jgi:hypothetical protein